MSWFRRTAKPYDDFYDVATAFIPGPGLNWDLEWKIPSDRFIIPTSIILEVVLAVASPGTIRYWSFDQYRHGKLLGICNNMQNSIGVGTWYYCALPGISLSTGSITYGPFVTIPLPFPWHFHPGDILKFNFGRFGIGDVLTEMRVTYRYWKIF